MAGNGIATFFGRLRRDTRGNVLAMTAAAIIPLLAMIGGAIDASRIYMAYTRLQQACDSGAIAGRKAMSNVTTLTTTERQKAEEFFDFNFPEGTYQAEEWTRSFRKGADGIVTGAAAIKMPTTIMKLFGYTSVPLAVTCEATLNIPNTDVMFVLDVTGSMLETPTGDTVSKLAGLKSAVKDFFAALGPGVAAGPGRIRYGFIPYSSNVNVGRLLFAANPSYLAGGTGSEQVRYQSRRAVTVTDRYIAAYGPESGYSNNPASVNTGNWAYSDINGNAQYPTSFSNLTQSQCDAKPVPPEAPAADNYGTPSLVSEEAMAYPDTVQTRSYSSSSRGTDTRYRYERKGYTTRGTCQLQRGTRTVNKTRTSTTTRTVTWAERQKFDRWAYEQRDDIDVSQLVQGTSAANPTYYPGYWTGNDPNRNYWYQYDYRGYFTGTTSEATLSTITWAGCIEEAKTVDSITASSSLTPPSNAFDLQIDLIPSNADTRWRPFLPQLQFARRASGYEGQWLGRGPGWINSGFAACPQKASRLSAYHSDYVSSTKSSAAFNGYVDSLTAVGGTYHDIGLIWGARFLSPDGIFAADNRDSASPGGYQISRHIVFMTDGTLDTRENANDPWGINNLDGRIAPLGANSDRMNETHQRRTEIICNSMKAKGFTVWVIGFGIATMPQELQDCASDANHWSVSSNSTQLRARFAAIAQTIGGLRLSQ